MYKPVLYVLVSLMQFTWFHVYLEGVYESICLTPIEMSHFNANLVYEYWGEKIAYSMVKNLWVEVYCPWCNTFKVCILWHQSLSFSFLLHFCDHQSILLILWSVYWFYMTFGVWILLELPGIHKMICSKNIK